MTEQIALAVQRLAILKYFPSGDIVQEEIMSLFERMVDKPERLDWLVSVLIDQVGEWPGPKEVRAIYCTRFKPADGVEAWSNLPGFTAMDSESLSYERHGQLTEGEKARKELAAAPEVKYLPLPPEEIEANNNLKLAVESTADLMFGTKDKPGMNRLLPEEGYEPPDWLQ